MRQIFHPWSFSLVTRCGSTERSFSPSERLRRPKARQALMARGYSGQQATQVSIIPRANLHRLGVGRGS
jgi:hypothetical protein